MKAIVMVYYVTDEADTKAIQDAMMDAPMELCPASHGGDCWCELAGSHILDIGDDEAVTWEVVKLDDEDF